jgi:hypothetical protein
MGISFDAAGNLYFADMVNSVIRKVNTSGVITNIAGNGTNGYSGDGGPATAASLGLPKGTAIDASGNLYIADDQNNVIRKINTSGIISTVAGNGSSGYSGDGGSATAATLNGPSSVAVDAAGNIYIADRYNYAIRKVNASGVISTFAGDGWGFFGSSWIDVPGHAATAVSIGTPTCVIADGRGNVYYAEDRYYLVRKIDSAGMISTVAGNWMRTTGNCLDSGAATDINLMFPSGISLDRTGNLYISEEHGAVIRKVTPSGILTTYAGNGFTDSFTTDFADCLIVWRSNEFVRYPIGLTVSPSGTVYFCEPNRIAKIGPNHNPYFASGPRITTRLCQNSSGFALNSLLKVNDADPRQILTWTLSGAGHGALSGPCSMNTTGTFVTPAGLMYTPDSGYTGPDTILVQVSDGYTSTNTTIALTVQPSAPIASISGPSSVCAGAYITLTPSVSGGTWSAANGTATVSGSGVVTGVSGTFTNTIYYNTTSAYCGTRRNAHPITVNRVPGVYPISAASTSVAVGHTITLADVTAGGTWSSSNASIASVGITGNVTGVTTGSANVSYTVTNACGSTSQYRAITVTAHKEVFDTENAISEGTSGFKVYPNPSQGLFILELPESAEQSKILISDMSGKSITQMITSNTREEFDTKTWAGGIYLIQVEVSSKIMRQKLVVE